MCRRLVQTQKKEQLQIGSGNLLLLQVRMIAELGNCWRVIEIIPKNEINFIYCSTPSFFPWNFRPTRDHLTKGKKGVPLVKGSLGQPIKFSVKKIYFNSILNKTISNSVVKTWISASTVYPESLSWEWMSWVSIERVIWSLAALVCRRNSSSGCAESLSPCGTARKRSMPLARHRDHPCWSDRTQKFDSYASQARCKLVYAMRRSRVLRGS